MEGDPTVFLSVIWFEICAAVSRYVRAENMSHPASYSFSDSHFLYLPSG